MSLNNKKLRDELCNLFEEMGEMKKKGKVDAEYLAQVNAKTTLGNTILRTASTELDYNKYRDKDNEIEFFEDKD